MCGSQMLNLARFDPSYAITKKVAGEKKANSLVDPGGFLGLQTAADERDAPGIAAEAKRKRLAAAAGAYDRPRTLSTASTGQPATSNRTILGGFGG